MVLLLMKAFTTVSLLSSFMSAVVYYGWFDSVLTEIGFQHYAELPSNFNMFFPRLVRMPLNTAVNIGYIVVGAYWCAVTTVCLDNKVINIFDAYLFYLFNVMAGFYGAIQTIRILTQMHRFAVMDQWSTLPFFMFILIWGLYISSGWSICKFLSLMIMSLASYGLTLYTPIGFEIALGVHIVLAVLGGVIGYWKYPNRNAQRYFVFALLSCAGFVGFKLIDIPMAQYHELFNKISGHFLSKIADIAQIHFVNSFFQSLIVQRFLISESKKSKSD